MRTANELPSKRNGRHTCYASMKHAKDKRPQSCERLLKDGRKIVKSAFTDTLFKVFGKFVFHTSILGSLRVSLSIAVKASPDTLLRDVVVPLVCRHKITVTSGNAQPRPADKLSNSRLCHVHGS